MIQKSLIRDLMARLERCKRPVLSVYVDVSPAQRASSPRGIVLQAKSMLDELAQVPADLRTKVLGVLGHELPPSRALAVFASNDAVELFPVHMELPLQDPQTGRAVVRWGEPYLTPLLVLLGLRPAHGVVFVDRDQWRCFLVVRGGIQELDHDMRALSPGELDTLQQSKQEHPAYLATRGGAAKDQAAHHVEVLSRRFFEAAVSRLQALVDARDVAHLILLGTEREVARFRSALPAALASRVVATLPSLPNPRCPAHEVQGHVAAVIDELDEERQASLLADVAERGITGLDACLAEMQSGRVQILVVPWSSAALPESLDRIVYQEAQSGHVSASEQAAKSFDPDGAGTRAVPLREVLPELAHAYNSQIEFVRGPHLDRLLQEMGGLAAIPRW